MIAEATPDPAPPSDHDAARSTGVIFDEQAEPPNCDVTNVELQGQTLAVDFTNHGPGWALAGITYVNASIVGSDGTQRSTATKLQAISDNVEPGKAFTYQGELMLVEKQLDADCTVSVWITHHDQVVSNVHESTVSARDGQYL